METTVHRFTRSGTSFGSYLLGTKDASAITLNKCTTFKEAYMAPLFRRSLELNQDGDGDEIFENTIDADSLSPSFAYPSSNSSSNPSTTSVSHNSFLNPSPTRSYSIAQSQKVQKHKSRDKVRSKARRNRQRAVALEQPIPAHRPRLIALATHGDLSMKDVQLESRRLPAGNWIGRRDGKVKGEAPKIPKTWTLDEVKAQDMEIIEWDGLSSEWLADSEGRGMIGLVAINSKDSTWMPSIHNASSALRQARVHGKRIGAFTPYGNKDPLHHRRGAYYSIATGVSFGGGSKCPGNLGIRASLKGITKSLIENKDIRRIAGFQSAAFAFYAPKLYQVYRSYLSRLYDHSPHLRPNFPTCSIFPACTFNLGPDTVTVDHTDFNNVAYGLCAITALGNYDPKLGGHLILFDLGLVIEFPPGATILIPSSVLRHGNTPIVSTGGKDRMSITQYCAGGLFRWVDYGFQTGVNLDKMPGGRAERIHIDGLLEERTEAALQHFSTATSLHKDHLQVFGRDVFK